MQSFRKGDRLAFKHKGVNSTNNNSFDYDDNGNMIYDPTKDMTISYNHLNLPSTVDFGNGNSIEWTYDADGVKLRKEVTSGNTTIEDRHYIDAVDYNNGKLVQVMHDYGRVTSQQPCDDNQYVNGLLDNTSLYEGKHVISDGYVIPPGSTTFEGVESVLLTEEQKNQSQLRCKGSFYN